MTLRCVEDTEFNMSQKTDVFYVIQWCLYQDGTSACGTSFLRRQQEWNWEKTHVHELAFVSIFAGVSGTARRMLTDNVLGSTLLSATPLVT